MSINALIHSVILSA